MTCRRFFMCVTIGAILFLTWPLGSIVRAGAIETIPVEDKGVYFPGLGIKTFISEARVNCPGGGIPCDVTTRDNYEIVEVSVVGPAVRVYNVYPIELHVPQSPAFDPNAPIDFFFLMATDPDTTFTDPASGLGPLPSDWVLQDASMTGTSGTSYTAQITPITDLSNLPTSSTYLTQITWDLSAFSVTTGNFYLAQVTFPNADEFFTYAIPTLSYWGIVVLCLVILAVASVVILRRRRARA